MRPGANRRDHAASTSWMPGLETSFNEARRESPGSRLLDKLSDLLFVRFNEARRESPGSQRRRAGVPEHRVYASMRPGANRRDHASSISCRTCFSSASMRPGANRRDHNDGGPAFPSTGFMLQ